MTEKKIIISIDPDLEELIPTFLENRSADLEKLKQALKAKDMETLRSVGHSLKGVGGGYGFDRITELGAAIESGAKNNDIPTIEQQLLEFEHYLANIEVRYE